MSDGVSEATAARLRDAAQRLLEGHPDVTDGALTLANLGREAAVSHATVHRAKGITADFLKAVKNRELDELIRRHQAKDVRIADIQRKLSKRNEENRALRAQRDRMAQQIQFLTLQNEALKSQMIRGGAERSPGRPLGLPARSRGSRRFSWRPAERLGST